MKIAIIGMGAWGTALASTVKRAGHSVVSELDKAAMWMIATSAADFRAAIKESKKFYKKQPIIICTKGMEPKTHLFMSEVLAAVLPECVKNIGVLSGPQFAAEVKANIPTGSTLAGPVHVRKVARAALAKFYLEETTDVIGTEICGCGKNAVSIVAGYFAILGKGENERAMMLARAWSEIADFGIAIGAKARTFIGLCGTGDLFLSATSKTSRNFTAGVFIAKKKRLVGTIEGISAISGLVFRAKKAGIRAPIIAGMEKLI